MKLRSLLKGNFPGKEINRLAIPAMIASCAEPIISLCDTAIIGHFSGPNDVSIGAASLATSFFLSLIWIFAQTKTAMSALLSRYFGANNLSDIKTLIPQMIVMNFGLGLLLYAATSFFSTEIFQFYNAKDQLLESTVSYFSIRSLGFPMVLSTVLIFGVLRGIQNTFWAMLITVIGGTLNIILDYLFMGGWQGHIDAMGVNGVAYASVISQAVMFILSLVLLLKKTPFGLNFIAAPHKEIKTLFGLTGNLIIRSFAVQTAYYFSTSFAAKYGVHHINVQAVFWNIWLFSAFFIEGYCSAGNALAGKYYGAKDFETLWRMSQFMWRRTLLIGFALSAFFLISYPFMAYVFLKNSYEIELFNQSFWMIALVQPFMAIAFIFDEMLKGLSQMTYLRNTLILATTLAFVPTIILADYLHLELYSIWLAFVAWMLFRGWRLASYFTKHYNI